MKRIAVIGTGIMGSGIAANYLKAGYAVTVWNRTPEKTKSLLELGAQLAESPKTATSQSDIIFEVTANDESSRSVWQGADGIIAGADVAKTLIASATLSISWTEELSKLCASSNFNFFDMPLTGGRVGAENGSLILLTGGDETKLEALKPDLEPISGKVLYFGASGSGMKYKLVLNSLQAAHLAAFGEAMRLAVAQGLDADKVGPALCERPGGEPTRAAWAAYQVDPIPLTFSVDWITKDLQYAQQMNDKKDSVIFSDTLSTFQKAQTTGLGTEDWAVVAKKYFP